MKIINTLTHSLAALGTPHPARDWYIVTGTTGVLILVNAVLALYFFFGIQSGAIIVPRDTATPSGPAVSREALTNVIDTYTTRRLNYEEQNFPNPLPDPAR